MPGDTLPDAGGSTATRPERQVRRVTMAVRCDAMSDYTEWTDWFGRPPDAVHCFCFWYLSGNPNSTPWSTKIATWDKCVQMARQESAKWPGIDLDWCVPLCTDGQPLEETTAGTHDRWINELLDVCLAHTPAGKIRIRFGHEAGLPLAWPWSAVYAAGDAARYVAAFDKFATLVRARSDRFVIEWSHPNNSYNQAGDAVDPLTFAPADASFDAVGADVYKVGAYNGQAYTVDRYCGAYPLFGSNPVAYSVGVLRDYAIARGKEFTFSEWGIGSEDPAFIRDMWEFAQNERNNCYHMGFWNKNAPSTQGPGSAYEYPCRLTGPNAQPYDLSKQVFKDLFGSGSTSYSEDSIASAWMSRVNTPASSTRRAAYDTLIKTLRMCGALGRMDGLFILAAHSAEQATISPIMSGSHNTLTPISTGRISAAGGLTFAADVGYTGDGSSGVLTVGGVNMASGINRKASQNDAHLGVYVSALPAQAATSVIAGIGNMWIGRSSAGRWIGNVLSGSLSVIDAAAGTGAGHMMWNRTGSEAFASYYNGAIAVNGGTASAAIGSDTMRICGLAGVGYSTATVAAVHWGASLTATQAAAVSAALATYLAAVVA